MLRRLGTLWDGFPSDLCSRKPVRTLRTGALLPCCTRTRGAHGHELVATITATGSSPAARRKALTSSMAIRSCASAAAICASSRAWAASSRVRCPAEVSPRRRLPGPVVKCQRPVEGRHHPCGRCIFPRVRSPPHHVRQGCRSAKASFQRPPVRRCTHCTPTIGDLAGCRAQIGYRWRDAGWAAGSLCQTS